MFAARRSVRLPTYPERKRAVAKRPFCAVWMSRRTEIARPHRVGVTVSFQLRADFSTLMRVVVDMRTAFLGRGYLAKVHRRRGFHHDALRHAQRFRTAALHVRFQLGFHVGSEVSATRDDGAVDMQAPRFETL